MKDLRIVFMGTPEFAVATLQMLLKNNYQVVAVVTAPDKPAGRGRQLQQSAIKRFALENKLLVLQPTNLKDEDFLETLKKLNHNLQIVVAFRMLPKQIWNLPTLGTFNLHSSLLPKYRGAAPIHWAIINGETKTGVTTFFIDEQIDTGKIIACKEQPIQPDETVGELHDKLMYLGAGLVIETVQMIENSSITTIIQNDNEASHAPKLTPENTKIDWQQTTNLIYNKIRGLNPFPTAWCILLNKEEILVKLYDVEKILKTHQDIPGKIQIKDSKIWVATLDGYIIINQLKLAGKKLMDSKSLLNGYAFSEDAKML